MRLVLATRARFEAVAEHLARCALTLELMVPQVFPARSEPGRARWSTPDGATTVKWRYHVNPDRRTLDIEGPDAAELELTLARAPALGVTSFRDIETQLREADDEEARLAAYLAAACLHERSVEVICWGLIHRSDYVGTGCVQALELIGDASVVPMLVALRENPKRAPDLRMLAGEAAVALRETLD